MAQLKNLIVNGTAKVVNKVVAPTFVGNLTGTATLATSTTGSVNGYTISSSVPSGAKFTDTVTTVSVTGSGNAITSMSASNGAITATKGTTFLTSHQDISGKQDASTAVTHTASTSVGASTTPVYVNASGVATACTPYASATVASATNATNATSATSATSATNATSAGVATKVGTSTVGSAGLPVYISSGTPTVVTGNTCANVLMNALDTGTSTPTGADYYIAQYAGGGTTTTTYHRRPVSALLTYMKSNITSVSSATSAGTVNGYTVSKSVPADAVFTDNNTVTAIASTTGSGNAVTSITASNGQLTVTKGTTFLTSHQDISGKANLSGATFTGAVSITSGNFSCTNGSVFAGTYASNTSQSVEYQTGVNGGAGRLYLYSQAATTGNRGLYTTSPAGSSTGVITITSANVITFSGTASAAYYADYAEFFPRGEETEEGDIIALDENSEREQYVKATNQSLCVVGVHSESYGHIVGGEETPIGMDFREYQRIKYIPVGLVGRVPVKFIGKAKRGTKVVPSGLAGVGRPYQEGDNPDNIIGYLVEQDDKEQEIRLLKVKLLK